MEIKLTSIYLNNIIEAFSFYTKFLGFIKLMFIPESELARVVSHEGPDRTALLLEPNGIPAAKTYKAAIYNAGLSSIVFGVEDIQKVY